MRYRTDVDVQIYLEDWYVVKNYEEFVEAIKKHKNKVTHISFDHDLAIEHYHTDMYLGPSVYNKHYKTFKYKTGYHCAKWLKRYFKNNNLELPKVLVHTQNPTGLQNILNIFHL